MGLRVIKINAWSCCQGKYKNTKKILEIVERLLYNKEIQDRTKEGLVKSAFP